MVVFAAFYALLFAYFNRFCNQFEFKVSLFHMFFSILGCKDRKTLKVKAGKVFFSLLKVFYEKLLNYE